MKIHPTAIIDPKAELHESVEVGPYSIIEGDVKIGEGTYIEGLVKIYSGTRIGKNNKIHFTCALGGAPQDLGFKADTPTYLTIGDNNTFRENVLISRASKEGQSTTVGNGCFFMGNVHIGHDVQIADEVIIVQNTVVGGHTKVEKRVFLSGQIAVHQFVRIGEYAMVGGCAKVVKDVPPFSTADGNPATIIGMNIVGLKRAGFKPEVRDVIKKAYKVFYHSGLNTKQALAELAKTNDHHEEVKKVIQFFESSDRGVTDHREI